MDAVVRQMRDAILDNDLKILAAVNARMALVARLEAYAAQNGREGLTPSRREGMLRYVSGANRGAVSDEDLQELFTLLARFSEPETPDA